ncbi:MAG: glycosyltransferase, partial [Endomicrobium sp.]|nr:glycosyltransferase [Endomicrobium sp.]
LLKERNRFSKGLFPWIGFKTKYFEYKNIKRAFGKSKWGGRGQLFLYALDGIISCSVLPLVAVPIFMAIVFIIISFVIFYKWVCGDHVDGWTLIMCLMLFSNTVIFFVLGQYISKIYIEVKQRPIYVIKQEV